MKIKLEPKWVYGRTLYYPRCDLSSGLVCLGSSRKVDNPAFTQKEVDLLRELGFGIGFEATDPCKTN